MAGYKDYAFHLTTALPALLLGVIPCGIIAILTARNYHGG
jgi:hypothetical protein